MLCSEILENNISKKKRILLQRILENILENQGFQKTAKFIERKVIVTLIKVDEMYNILKSLLATGYLSRQEGEIVRSKFLLELKSDSLP